CLQALEFPHSF
nr:immunoglobulin light chain junction region [Macaca mulatta]